MASFATACRPYPVRFTKGIGPAVLALVFATAGCSPVSTAKPSQGMVLITETQEFAMGDQFATALEQGQVQGKVEFVGVPGGFLKDLGDSLVAASKRPGVPTTFQVINDATINAFAVPGHTYYYRGIIELAETESEFAAIMAHEIGHIVARHSAKTASRGMLAGLGQEAAVLAVGGGDRTRALSGLILTGAIKKYGRDEERQADLLAVEECIAAGIDPRGASEIFLKFEKIFKETPNSIDLFFSDHPYSHERAVNVEAYIAKLNPSPGLRKDSPAYQEWRRAVMASPAPAPKETPK
jgi:predicted Zn-dependent protease